ncbi:hypothetical protein HNP84_001189 [Thermocatellispora tengchongensis]|uniref:Uncharacterized protein n=1 Tax=Thermocatellispora tengchongensis TaxID=1073253 RepID=A0A840P0M4_9ACTN|nr:hypothetical protein [Thermocatellispora tengchongensis]MBB5131483.1 hypothetical protein [Thermocatellispora tengchongensis]
MVVVQRIVTRWSKQSRGAAEATRRGALPTALPVPPAPEGAGPLLLHDVLLDEEAGYAPAETVAAHPLPARVAGLALDLREDGVLRVRSTPGFASYPIRRREESLFRLAPGHRGRYLANFRFTGCQCSARWWYEQWTVNVSHGVSPAVFPADGAAFDARADARVSLYGGPSRS